MDINITIPEIDDDHNNFNAIKKRDQKINFHFNDGQNTFESVLFDAGIAQSDENSKLKAIIELNYDYDEKNKVITVFGSDYISDMSMSLNISDGKNILAKIKTSNVVENFDNFDLKSLSSADLEKKLSSMAIKVNESLIDKLIEIPGLTVQIYRPFPELTAAEFKDLLAVYKDGKFHDFYQDGMEVDSNDVLITLKSAFGGEVRFNKNEAFANVIGSTNDPKISGETWIKLWANQFGEYPSICTSYNFNGFQCGNKLVGGHVIKGKVATQVQKGSNSVYIFPICIQHNNDDNVYMGAVKYFKGIWLKNYLGH